MKMRSALGRVRGHGSAKSGTGRWSLERLTSLALAPMSLMFVAFMASGTGADYAALKAWMSLPGNMAMAIVFIMTVLLHGALGLIMIIEDYVHDKAIEIASITAVRFGAMMLCVFAIGAILKIGLGS